MSNAPRLLALLALAATGHAQQKFTLEDILSPAYPFDLVAAADTDRIAWIAYEEGRRNVYTAVAPEFEPVRLTDYGDDDGIDMSSLRISADGSVLVFVRGHAPNRDGWVANPTSGAAGSERAIWAVRTDGGRAWRIAEGANPALSPTGRWVLTVRDGRIFGLPVDAHLKPEDVSRYDERPLLRNYGASSAPQWSPDGSKVAFVSSRGDHSYIAVFDMATSKVSYLAPGVDRDTSPTWSPDGDRIAFIRRPGLPFGAQSTGARGDRGARRGSTPPANPASRAIPGLTRAKFAGGYTMSIWVADVATGKAREVWHDPPTDSPWSRIRSIAWAGEHAVFSLERGNWQHRYSVPLTGGTATPIDLTPGEGLVEWSTVSPDGRHLYYCTNAGDIDRRHLFRTPIPGGATVQLTTGDGIETYPVALASGKGVAVLSAGPRRPQSVAIVDAGGGAPRALFPTLGVSFPTAGHVTPRNVVLTAPDGVEFHNQVFVPSDSKPGERHPAVLYTHGGPRRQMLLGYHYRHFYHMAYAVNQYLANHGYVVISVNYRGGIGYGAEFRNSPNRGSRGNTEYQDVLAAGRYLANRDDVDPDRIGLWGLSYGGLLTAQGLARNSDLFAAGVDIAGVHLWGNSTDPDSRSFQSSPIGAIDGWKSPVLLIHGDDDRNVAFSQTTGLVQLLRARGVHHELIVFPDDVHSSLLYRRWLHSFRAMDDFFERFLRAKGSR